MPFCDRQPINVPNRPRRYRLIGAFVVLSGTLAACAQTGATRNAPADPAAARAEREMCVELKRLLFQDSIVRSYAVYARCDGDIVTLNGTVPDFHARAQAERIAASMPGVRMVRNNLRVSDPDEPIRY